MKVIGHLLVRNCRRIVSRVASVSCNGHTRATPCDTISFQRTKLWLLSRKRKIEFHQITFDFVIKPKVAEHLAAFCFSDKFWTFSVSNICDRVWLYVLMQLNVLVCWYNNNATMQQDQIYRMQFWHSTWHELL